jgi:hypothetical protein
MSCRPNPYHCELLPFNINLADPCSLGRGAADRAAAALKGRAELSALLGDWRNGFND